MTKRLLGLLLCLAPAAVHASGTTLTWAKGLGYTQPTGGDQQFGDAMTAANGTTTVLYNDGNDGLHLVTFSPGGVAGSILDFAGTSDITSELGLAVDGSGNIFVGGRTNNNNEDFGVEKYSSAGVLQWATLSGISSPNGLDGYQHGVGLDAAGDAYVVGRTSSNGGPTTLELMKVDHAFGGILWTRSAVSRGSSSPSGIAVNPAGGAFVLEIEQAQSGCSTTYLSYYDTNGTVVWSRSLGMCTNTRSPLVANGLVYLIKDGRPETYDPADGHLVTSGYFFNAFPAGFNPASLAVDAGGTVYIGGTMSPSGGGPNHGEVVAWSADLTTTLWAVSEDLGIDEGSFSDSLRTTVDAAGNAYQTQDTAATSGGGSQCSATADLIWRRFDHATGAVSHVIQDAPLFVRDAVGIAQDAGYVYVAGQRPKRVLKYDSSGNIAAGWPVTYTSTYYCTDKLAGIAVGGTPAKVYVALHPQIQYSSTVPSNSVARYVVARYDAGTGAFETEYATGDLDNNMDDQVAMLADAAGNVWLCGNHRGSGSGNNGSSAYIASFSAAGTLNWQFDGEYSAFGGPTPHLGVDPAGNVYVCKIGSIGPAPAFAAFKLDTGGNPVWSNAFAGVNNISFPLALTVAGSTVYIVGAGTDDFNQPTYFQGVLMAVTDAGVPLWTKTYSGGAQTLLWDVKVAPSGEIVVSGQISATISVNGNNGPDGSGTSDALFQGYDPVDPCPAPLWSVRYDSGLGEDVGDFVEPVTHTLVARTPAGFSLRRYATGGGAPVLGSLFTAAPSPAEIGQLVTFSLHADNSGGRDAADVLASMTVTGGWAAVAPPSGPDIFAPISVQADAGITFKWTTTATSPGTVQFSGTLTGVDSCSGTLLTPSVAGASLVTGYRSVLASVARVSSTLVSTGELITVSLTVTNNGLGNAVVNGLTGTVFLAAGNYVQLLPGSFGGPMNLVAGTATTFVWTYSATGAGWESFTASATGTDPIFGAKTVAPAALSTTITGPANFSATLGMVPATVTAGQWFQARVVVTNTGTFAATNVSPAAPRVGPGGGLVSAALGPVPAGPQIILPGSSTTFTWSYTATGAGAVTVSVTVTGTDTSPLGRNPSVLGAGSFVVQTPPSLSGQMVQLATTLEIGQQYVATFTMTNAGQAAANGINIKVYDNGSATVILLAGPSPAPPATLNGGQSFFLTVTATGTTAGTYFMTGSVTGTDANTGAYVSSPKFTSNTVTFLNPPQLVGALKILPAQVDTGQNFLVTLTVSNTGGVNANGVVGATYFVSTGPGAVTAAAGPTPAMPVTVAAGSAVTFTWTYTGAAIGALTLTMSVSGIDAFTLNPVYSGTILSGSLLVQAPAALAGAIATYNAGSVDVGQSFVVTYTVTNTGGATANAVRPTTPYKSAGAGAATASLPTPPGSVVLAGNASQTFTWTFTGSTAGSVVLTTSAAGTDANTVAALGTAYVSATVLVQTPANFTGAIVQYATTIERGQSYVATLTVTNTGGATANGISIKTYDNGSGTVTMVSGPTPSVQTTMTGGQAVTYTVTSVGGLAGTYFMTASITGIDGNTGATVMSATFTSNSITVVNPPAFSVYAAAYGPTRNTGQSYLVTLTVTNTGGGTANGITVAAPFTLAGTGGASQSAAPTPPMPFASLAAGFAQTFTWTFTGSSAGTVLATETVTGTSALSGLPVTSGPVTTNGVTIQAPAALAGSLAAYRATVNTGQTLLVTYTVTNTGGATATGVTPGTPYKSAGAGTTSNTLPNPAGAVALAGGASQTFSWTFTGATAGSVILTATSSGTDANTLALLVPAFVSATFTVQTPAALVVAQTIPNPVKQGQVFSVAVTVSNTGGATALTVVPPADVAPSPGGQVTYLSGPLPAGPFALAGSSGTTFIYQYTANAANITVNDSVTVTGMDANTGAALAAQNYSNTYINGAAVLGSWISETLPALKGGQASVITLTVSNCGSADATSAGTPFLTVSPVVSPTSYVTVTGPSITSFYLVPGAKVDITWSATGIQTATLVMTASASGLDVNDGTRLVTEASTTLNVTSSLGSNVVAAPSTLKAGETFEVDFTVIKNGVSLATNVTATVLSISDPSLVQVLTGPSPAPVVIPNGAPHTFTWTYLAVKDGAVTFTITAGGTVSGQLDTTRGTVSVTIKKAVDIPAFDGETLVYPNPVTGDRINLAVHLKDSMEKLELDVYNTGFQRVYHGEWPALPQGDSLLEITGVKLWAPGTYLARVTATKAGGGTQPFKTFRIGVKR